MAKEIIVEFVPDFSKLKSGTQALVDSGVLSKEILEGFTKAQQAIDESGKKVKSNAKNLDDVSKKVKGVGKDYVDAFKKQAGDSVKGAEDSLKKFRKETEETGKTTQSVRQRIKELREQLAFMKLNNQENTAEFKTMRAEMARLVDTMSDVGRETRELASDSRQIDTVVNAVHGLTSAYQIAAGASALLGVKDEKLQETLVKLNALMAISSGFQQLQNLLQKEGNLVRLVTLGQTKLQTVYTNLQTAAQSRNIIVTTGATIAMRVLNTVMKANPVFLLVGAFAALAGAMTLFSGKTKSATDEVEELNKQMEQLSATRDKIFDDISMSTDESISALKKQGASEDELTTRTIEGLKAQQEAQTITTQERLRQLKLVDTYMFTSIDNIEIAQKELAETNAQLLEDSDNKWLKRRKPILEALIEDLKKQQQLQSQILISQNEFDADHRQDALKNAKAFADQKVLIAREGSFQEIEAKKQAVRADLALELDNANLLAGERAKIIADANKKIDELNRQSRLLTLENQKSDINAQLALTKEGTEENLKLQVEAMTVQAKIDIENAKGNAHKKEEIWANYLKSIDKMTKEFQDNADKKSIQAVIDTLNARSQAINISQQEQLNLTIARLNAERALELAAVENNKAKEAEINARFDRQIMDARFAALQRELERELEFEEAHQGRRRRALERAADNDKLPFEKRRDAIKEIEQIQLASVDKQIDALKKQDEAGTISLSDFVLKYEQLSDKKAEIEENTAERIKAINQDEFEVIIAGAQEVFGIFSQISGLISEQENAHIQSQRNRLQDLRDAGLLTDKEFQERSKRLDAADKRAKRDQAIREKSLALFSATINAAEQIIKALDNPIKLAFVLAMTAAQIALIASKPIPAFAKGTKSAPRGIAQVGETGTEIIQTNYGYYVADHPQIVWLKGGERIYNPKETEYIFNTVTPNVKQTLLTEKSTEVNTEQIDVSKLSKSIGDEIAKHPRLIITLDENGFSTTVLERNNRTRYLNKRYTFNG